MRKERQQRFKQLDKIIHELHPSLHDHSADGKYFWIAPFYPKTKESRESMNHIMADTRRRILAWCCIDKHVAEDAIVNHKPRGKPAENGNGSRDGERNRRRSSVAKGRRWEARRMRNCAVRSIMTTMNRRRETVRAQASHINLPGENRAETSRKVVSKNWRWWRVARLTEEKNEILFERRQSFSGEISL